MNYESREFIAFLGRDKTNLYFTDWEKYFIELVEQMYAEWAGWA